MNILFISSLFPNSLQLNRGVYSLQIVREMARFANVRVVAPFPTLGMFSFIDSIKKYRTNLPIPDIETIDSLTIYHPRYFAVPKMGFLHPNTLYTTLKPLIRQIHAEWAIDAVNSHWLFPDGVAVQRICATLGIPVMLTPLGTDLNSYLGFRFRRGQIRDSLIGADRVSLLNREMFRICEGLGVSPSRMVIIPNGVDTRKFNILDRSQCRKDVGLADDRKIILFVGNLVPVKSVDTLFKAFAANSGALTASAKLVIVGSGYLEMELKNLAASLKVSDYVTFIGTVKHESLPVWMNAADCLCLPSLSEGHPNVMMESLACGTPVVASSVGSVPDFIDSDTGFTIRPLDVEDLAAKLLACINTNYDRRGVRSRVAKYTWENCGNRYVEEITKILPIGSFDKSKMDVEIAL